MEMPPAAEDDYEEGLQDLQQEGPGGTGMGAINLGMGYGPEGGEAGYFPSNTMHASAYGDRRNSYPC